MKRDDLIRRLAGVRVELAIAASWNTRAAVDRAEDSYVFELLCLLSLCAELKQVATLKVVERQRKALWPRGPADKCNFSYVQLTPNRGGASHEFDVNPGIHIEDRYGKERAPDISITRVTDERSGDATPRHADVVAIWDAKFTEKDTKRLADTAVSDFLFTADQLGFPRAPAPPIAGLSNPSFARSGLITNARESTEKDPVYRDREMHEVAGFPDAPKARPDYTASLPAAPAAPAPAAPGVLLATDPSAVKA